MTTMLVGEGAKLDVHGCKTVDMASSFGKVCGPSPTPGPQSFPYRLSDSCRARLSAVDECGESTTVHGTAGAALQYSSPRAAGMLGYRRFWNSSSSFSHASPFSSVSMRPRARLPAGFSSRPHCHRNRVHLLLLDGLWWRLGHCTGLQAAFRCPLPGLAHHYPAPPHRPWHRCRSQPLGYHGPLPL